MPRSCSLCQHPERTAIEQALAAKEPYRAVAKRFGTSPAALYRHQQDHAQPHANPVPLDAPPSQAVPGPDVSALVAAAQHLHTVAQQSQRQFVEVRSLYDPQVLWQIHALNDRLVEVTALLVQLTGVLGERIRVSPPPVHLPERPTAPPLQTQDVAALPWPQWRQEAEALAALLDTAFNAWSVPQSAQRLLRQMIQLLLHLTNRGSNGSPEIAPAL